MAIQIKPAIEHQSRCPYSEAPLLPKRILWQGLHVCVESECPDCQKVIIEDLSVGHGISHPYQVDVAANQVFGPEPSKNWLGEPMLASLRHPKTEEISISKQVFACHKRVVILNCLDYLYGHAVLKLLNAERHLTEDVDKGLVLIIPSFLKWMVPKGVAEVWTVGIPLKKGKQFYSAFDTFVSGELARFDEVFVSEAHSHPSRFDISSYTGVAKHDFSNADYRVTFVWREDRTWMDFKLFNRLKKLGLLTLCLRQQNQKIQTLFEQIRREIPAAKLTVAGLGTATQFPAWIEDARVSNFDAAAEKRLCEIYANSRVVVGIHGSNMLLPSGHAGMTIDLLPKQRWGNFAQDILYHEDDPRMAAFRYRYLPAELEPVALSRVVLKMLHKYGAFRLKMCADKESHY